MGLFFEWYMWKILSCEMNNRLSFSVETQYSLDAETANRRQYRCSWVLYISRSVLHIKWCNNQRQKRGCYCYVRICRKQCSGETTTLNNMVLKGSGWHACANEHNLKFIYPTDPSQFILFFHSIVTSCSGANVDVSILRNAFS